MKIHVGCGQRNFGSTWLHVDGGDFDHVTGHDVFLKPLPDNCADVIYSSHMIEYFDRVEVIELLQCWRRVIKPGGVLRLAVPDFYKMVQLYAVNNNIEMFLGPLYGRMKMNDEYIYHKTAYDKTSLTRLLEENGFKNVVKWNWRKVEHGHVDDCSQAYLPKMDKENGILISLNLECTK